MSLGQNIKRLRESHGMNQAQLAEIAGVTDKAVSTWENDLKIPRMGAIQKIADYFGLLKSDIIEDSSSLARFEREQPSVERIPVVGRVVAGIPTEAVEDVVDWEEIPFAQARRGDFIGLKVKGASMEPRFLDGDTVIVRRQPDVESGEIATSACPETATGWYKESNIPGTCVQHLGSVESEEGEVMDSTGGGHGVEEEENAE